MAALPWQGQSACPATRSQGCDEYLQKQAQAQITAPEDQLIETVRAVLARHKISWS